MSDGIETYEWWAEKKDLYGGIDTCRPHSARVWNYLLGGKDNYEVDRDAADEYRQTFPGILDIARHSRAFLCRSVRYLAGEVGVGQFLDIGPGLPTVDNTHEIAQRVAPDARVVYVDNDPLVFSHVRALLTSGPPGVTGHVAANLHQPEDILAKAAGTLRYDEPVAVLLMGVLGYIPDDTEARSVVARLMAGLPAGSHLVLYDRTDTDEAAVEAQEGYDETGADPYRLRSPEQIAAFAGGLDIVAPGVVSVSQWRIEATPFGWPPPAEAVCLVGRKR